MSSELENLIKNSSVVKLRNGETYFVYANIFKYRPFLAKFAKTKPNRPLCVLKLTKSVEITAMGLLYGKRSKRKIKKDSNMPIRCDNSQITIEDIEKVKELHQKILKFFEDNVGEFKNITLTSLRPNKVGRREFTQVTISPSIIADDDPSSVELADEFFQMLFGTKVQWEVKNISRLIIIDVPLEYTIQPDDFVIKPLPISRGKKKYKFNITLQFEIDGEVITRTASVVVSKRNSIHVSFSQPAKLELDRWIDYIKREILRMLWETNVIQKKSDAEVVQQ